MSETGPAGVAILDSDTTGILGLGEGRTRIAIYMVSDLGIMVSDLGIAAPADAATENGEAVAAQDEEAVPAGPMKPHGRGDGSHARRRG